MRGRPAPGLVPGRRDIFARARESVTRRSARPAGLGRGTPFRRCAAGPPRARDESGDLSHVAQEVAYQFSVATNEYIGQGKEKAEYQCNVYPARRRRAPDVPGKRRGRNDRKMRGVNTHMHVKTPGKVRWFGEFRSEAVAADSTELTSAIADFISDYPPARGRREGRRYALDMKPFGVRMHQVSVEAAAPDGATLEATIPVGRPAGRRTALTTVGWAVERTSSGTRYYTRRFNANDAAPTDIVKAVDDANRTLYGNRAKNVRWSLSVRPVYLGDEPNDGGETRPERRPLRRPRAVTAVVIAGLGLWVSERASSDQERYLTALAPPLTAAIVVGGTALAVLVYLSGISSRFAEGYAEFWGGGALTRFAVDASFSLVATLGWSFALVALFRPS
jgi:hypothetical protein